ncbi:MAG: 6-phosphogluconolactonase [Nitrospirae bacterium]|nr:6-phosphogluconolactonase [Nitrospirota bacterium]
MMPPGRIPVALAGGATPEGLYRLLAAEPWRSRIDWERIDFFWGDERCVSPEHPASNYGMARRALLDPLGIPASQVFRIRGELPPDVAASEYDSAIESYFGGGNNVHFAIALLGLGADGHTASLFPGSPLLLETGRCAAAVLPGPDGMNRVTLTLPAINSSDHVIFLVTGSGKAEIAARLVAAKPSADIPASLVRLAGGEVEVFLDEGAARLVRDVGA